MRRGPRRIAIINTVACNGGDAAILEAIVRQLRGQWPGVVVTAFDMHPDVAAQYYDFVRFDAAPYWSARASGDGWNNLQRGARWIAATWLRGLGVRRAGALAAPVDRRVLARLGRSDVVISTGGTYLVATYSLKTRFFGFLCAHLVRRPLVLHAQTIGPFHGRFDRLRMQRVLRWADAVFVRDEQSRSIVLELGAPRGRTRLVPDVVFALAGLGAIGRLREARIGDAPRIAVSVRDLKPFANGDVALMPRYRAAVAGLITWLVRERSATVEFLSSCQGIAQYRFDDAHVAERIRAGLPADVQARVSVVGGHHEPDELVQRYSDYDAVVATRMHAAIMALCAGTPVLPISSERKITALFADLAAPFPILAPNAATGSALIESFQQFERALPIWRGVLAARLEEWRRQAHRPQQEIARLAKQALNERRPARVRGSVVG